MAPFRAARSTRSGGRQGAQGDFDIVDGLPVRQWRLQEATIGLEPPMEEIQDAGTTAELNDSAKPGAWPEPPMPRGSNLYAPWCQQLLRAARAGRTQKRKRDIDGEDDRDNEANDEHAPSDISKQGFLVRRWAQLPRQMENAEPEYLAERRKGLPREQPGFINGMANGVIDTVVVEAPEEPVRRRMPPPPRKKSKKGRQKKLAFTDGEGVSAAAEDQDNAANGSTVNGSKVEDGDEDGDEEDDEEDDAEDNEPAGSGDLAPATKSVDMSEVTLPSLAEVPSAAPSEPSAATADTLASETLPTAIEPQHPPNPAFEPIATEEGAHAGDDVEAQEAPPRSEPPVASNTLVESTEAEGRPHTDAQSTQEQAPSSAPDPSTAAPAAAGDAEQAEAVPQS